MPNPPEIPASESKLIRRIYTGVTEARRAKVVGTCWMIGAIQVDATKTGDTYTVTALFEED